VAPYRRRRVIENIAPPVAQNCFRFGICLAVQLVFGAVQRLDQNVGIVEKVVVNDPLDCLALLSWNFGSFHRSGMQSGNKTVDQSEGHKWRAIEHHVIYSAKKWTREGIGCNQREFATPPAASSMCSASLWMFSARL